MLACFINYLKSRMQFLTRKNEASPLLPQTITDDVEEKGKKDDGDRETHPSSSIRILESLSFVSQPTDKETIPVPELPPFSILMEVVGCRNLQFTGHDDKDSKICNLETYCVIQYGLETIHRTLPYKGHTLSSNPSKAARIGKALKRGLAKVGGGSGNVVDPLAQALRNPIWTIQHDSLWKINVTPKDIANHKAVAINVWGRPMEMLRGSSTMNPILMGKIRVNIADLVAKCNEERIELPLMDELGRGMKQSGTTRNHTGSDDNNDKPSVAFRCRIATPADLEFVNHWNQPLPKHIMGTTPTHKRIVDEVWQKSKVLEGGGDNQQTRALLLTELPENRVQGASLSSAMKGALGKPAGRIWVKPYPDPDAVVSSLPKRKISPSKQQSTGNHMHMTPDDLKQETRQPSRKWLQAGNSKHSYGRLYLEILSAHDLPNVDLGETMGNKTDAFCSVVYGDTMVQTDLIDDELSPHWLPWTRRAFVFHISKDWVSPSSVALYLGVFGYKRKPIRRHKPIGRVEIHPFQLQRNTLYELDYNIYKDSHAVARQAQGSLRIRLRIEIDDERAALVSPLSHMLPSSTRRRHNIYINVQTKKSLAVARFTACGEYDNAAKFSLGVLQGYIDEIIQGYIRRLVYAVADEGRSLIFWQAHTQMQVSMAGGVVVFPLYSFLVFIMGMMAVEHPQLIPGITLCFASMFMLAQLHRRNRSSNPWKRCNSFGHYARAFIGRSSSTPKFDSIAVNEGWEESKADEERLKKRIERDQEFAVKKEAVEKELEKIEQFRIESKSKDFIHLELLEVLGKVQGIVGDVCRLIRFIDSIIMWEEGDLAFFLTLALLGIGAVFLLLPWAFLFRWTGRVLVIGLLGPQNALLDIFYIQKQSDDKHKLRVFFQKRVFQSRIKTEDIAKMRAFRQTLFGKYSVAIPSSLWTPHSDIPLPTSMASYEVTKMEGLPALQSRLSGAAGQLLFGDIIPRPQAAMEETKQFSLKERESIEAVVALMESNLGFARATPASARPSIKRREPSILLDAGFEVTDLFDEEAQYVKDVLKPAPAAESTRELEGVEIMPDAATLSTRFLPAWKSVHDFPSDDLKSLDICSSSSSSSPSGEDNDWDMVRVFTTEEASPRRSLNKDHRMEQSTVELGVEIAEEFESEAIFGKQSWRESSSVLPTDIKTANHVAHQRIQESIRSEGEGSRRLIGNSDQIEQMTNQSTVVLGVEIAEEFKTEAAFGKQCWRESSASLPIETESGKPMPHQSLQETISSRGQQAGQLLGNNDLIEPKDCHGKTNALGGTSSLADGGFKDTVNSAPNSNAQPPPTDHKDVAANELDIEIAETFDNEAAFASRSWQGSLSSSSSSSNSSNNDHMEQLSHQSANEFGVEIAEEFADEAAFASRCWQGSSSSSLAKDGTANV